ncbi:MAG: TIR domain-containing protein [Pseudomonadota bacterium]
MTESKLRKKIDVILDFCFGYDIFISYSRLGWSEVYALALAKRLAEPPELRCFVDSRSMEAGPSWIQQGRRALRKSSKIYLLATPEVDQSRGVEEELDYNAKLGKRAKPVTIVDVAGAWASLEQGSAFKDRLEGCGVPVDEGLRIEEPNSDLPSDEVIERIRTDFTIRSENARRIRLLLIGACTFFALSVVAIFASLIANDQRLEAALQARTAKNNEAQAFAALSRAVRNEGRPVDAAKLALSAWPRRPDSELARTRASVFELNLIANRLRERHRLEYGDPVHSVAFSADGVRLAIAGGEENTARVLNTTSGREIAHFEGHDDTVLSVAFSPDGTHLATGSDDGTARIWSLTSGQETMRLTASDDTGFGNGVRDVAFSPDKYLATGSADGTVRV